jgi:predicted TIM-barrel fold metal-dependent hydrolase
MAVTEKSSIKSMEDLDVVVDSDFHLRQNQEQLIPHLPDPWKTMLTSGYNDNLGHHSQLYPAHGMITGTTLGKVEPRSTTTPDEIREGMEKMKADMALLTPGLHLYLNHIHHDQFAVAFMQAYNEWIQADILGQTSEDDGMYPGVIVSSHRPNKSAEEIEKYAAEDRIKFVSFPGGGVFPSLGDQRYWPIYEAAEKHDLPVLIHNAAGDMMFHFPRQYQAFSRFSEVHACAHPFVHMTNLASLVIQGVPERFPDLNFVMQEAGLGWIPYFMRRLDHEYSALTEDAPMLEKLPSEYILDQFFFTSHPVEGTSDPVYVCDVIKHFDGANNLLFASDYPHFDFDEPGHLISRLRGTFSDQEIANIYGETALEVFDL